MFEYGNPLQRAPHVDDAKVEVSHHEVAQVPLRILGPEKMWGGELRVFGPTVFGMEDLLKRAGQESGQRLPGYIIDEPDGSVSCHISRLPRRINLEVPPEKEFVTAVQAAQKSISAMDFNCLLQIEQLSSKEEFRVILGLEEGYFESRRKDILRQIDDFTLTTVHDVKDMFMQRIGTPTDWGIDLDSAKSVTEIRKIIDSVSMSKVHTTEEVLAELSSEFQVTPCMIYSVAPEYIYKEPAVRIVAADSEVNLEKLVLLAAKFRQARFSLERLHTGEAFNIEILADSDNTAARFG
jgi:hypothetical protein